MCWFSQPSPPVQTKVSIDVSGLPDQENRMSPDMILYFESRLASVNFFWLVMPSFSSPIFMTGNPTLSWEKSSFLNAEPLMYAAQSYRDCTSHPAGISPSSEPSKRSGKRSAMG